MGLSESATLFRDTVRLEGCAYRDLLEPGIDPARPRASAVAFMDGKINGSSNQDAPAKARGLGAYWQGLLCGRRRT